MKFRQKENTYFIKLKKGENIIENLLNFLEKNNIKAGYFNGLGAVSKAILGHYDLETKSYTEKEFNGQREITSFHGNISWMKNKPYIHAHISLGDNKMNLIGGHCKEAVAAATCEIILVEINLDIKRKFDEEIGLNLWEI